MSLLRNPKAAQIAVAAFVLLFVGALATKCHGADLRWNDNRAFTQFSYGRTVSRGETDVVDLNRTWPVAWNSDAQYRLGITLIGTSSYGGQEQPNNFRAKAQYFDGFGPWSVGLGLSYGQNADVYNGSKMNFALSLEYRFSKLPITIQYAHDSNAGTVRPNLGRDYILVGYRFQ